MAFQQKEWKNRLSENPTRRLLTPVDGSASFQVDVTRAEGTIMQQGDPFNAANMNDLEQRIADAVGGGDENMAPIEEGPTSANPYAVNDLLIYNGQLYRVTSAIAIGNSLVENVNIKATTLGDEHKNNKSAIATLENELTANGNRIYMDYKNGKYGYNTSPSRGADTFFPFKGVPEESNGQVLYNARSYGRGGSGHSYGVSGSVTIQKAGIVSICGSAQAAYSSGGSVTLNGASIFNSSGAHANPLCSLIKSVSVGDVIAFNFTGYGSGSEGYEACGGNCAITLFSMD